MAMTMHVDVVSAEEEIWSGTAEFVAAPAEMGEIGIQARHAPLLTRIKPGSLRIKVANSTETPETGLGTTHHPLQSREIRKIR